MTMPTDVPIIDTMLGIPRREQTRAYDFMRPLFQDAASKTAFEFPAQYMFKAYPKVPDVDDYVGMTLSAMDRFGIGTALLGFDGDSPDAVRALREYPDRFVAELFVDPNRGMDEVRRVERLHRELDLRGVSGFGAGVVPQVPIGDKRWYPIYAKCVELGLPIFSCVGVPGPRVPMMAQHVRELDELLRDFPELVFVVRHGGEPWVDEIVAMMRRHPNLHYSTTAFAPRYYPDEILEFANGAGADQVLYGGYFPAGLTLDRIFAELPNLPLSDEVWPKFLRHNAARLLRIGV